MQISLRPEFQKFIEEKVRNGEYADADEVVNDALGMLKAHAEMSPEELEELRREIDIGLEQADRGEFVEFTAEDVIAEGKAELRRRRQGNK